MRFMLLAAVAALAFASTADAKSCKDAKGHFVKCPAAAAAPAKSSMMAAAPAKAAPAKSAMMAAAPAKATATHMGADKCKTGVPCGKACIPKGKVCHKS